ncbi:MAG: hypothetical protein Q7S21_06370 [archaeon]|nr:hypothetical protein [archaeon]
MSKTILAAMRKHKTPTEFIQRFVLPSIKRGQVPNLARMVTAERRKRFDELKLPKGEIGTIVFADKENPKHLCYFQVSYTSLKGKDARPTLMKLFAKVLTFVSKEDFEEAVKHSGKKEIKHSTGTGEREPSVSHNLLFSHDWLKHWSEEEKMEAEFRGKRIYYLVDHKVYEELNKYQWASENIDDLIGIIMVKGGRSNPQHYLIEKRLDRAIPGMDAFNAFYKITSRHHALFRKLINSSNVNEAGNLIAQHFKVDKRFAQKLAEILMKVLNTSGGRSAALEIAKGLRK